LKLYGLVSFGHWIDLFLISTTRRRGLSIIAIRSLAAGPHGDRAVGAAVQRRQDRDLPRVLRQPAAARLSY